MRERVVAVLGAGNLRCGPPVLAAIAAWRPDDLVEVRLWDANEERLDLFDRFIRACLDKSGTEHNVRSSSDHVDTLNGATDVVFAVHEDCARRLLGLREPELFAPEDASSLVDQVRGDPNKPTPPEQLSAQTRVILSNPIEAGVSREEAIKRADDLLLEQVPRKARILNLQLGVRLPTDRRHESLDWPPEVAERDLPIVPHQVLRWIHGEESLSALLAKATDSLAARWLDA